MNYSEQYHSDHNNLLSLQLIFDFALQITACSCAQSRVPPCCSQLSRRSWNQERLHKQALSCGSSLWINYTDTCSPHPSEYLWENLRSHAARIPECVLGQRGKASAASTHPLVARRQITINTTVAWPNEQAHFISSCKAIPRASSPTLAQNSCRWHGCGVQHPPTDPPPAATLSVRAALLLSVAFYCAVTALISMRRALDVHWIVAHCSLTRAEILFYDAPLMAISDTRSWLLSELWFLILFCSENLYLISGANWKMHLRVRWLSQHFSPLMLFFIISLLYNKKH